MRRDWKLTPDGDLDLGSSRVNRDAEILYRHPDRSVSTEQGNGKEIIDLTYISGRDAEAQLIMSRLKTEAPDWYHHPNMGGNLSDLVGEPNTKETGEQGEEYIKQALTYSNLYHFAEVDVRAIPVSANEILFMITIYKARKTSYRIPIIFDLEHGSIAEYRN